MLFYSVLHQSFPQVNERTVEMSTPNIVNHAGEMLASATQRGLTPVAFMMSGNTMRAIAQDAWEVRKRRMSVLGRFWQRLWHGHDVPRLEFFHGLAVAQFDALPDGLITLQAVGPMGGQSYGQQPQAADQSAANAPPEEFVLRDPAPAGDLPEGEVRPTLNDLSSGTGERPSSSDVLIKALSEAEDLSGVVVLRVHQDGSVDFCGNINQFALVGLLQKAQMYLAQRGQ